VGGACDRLAATAFEGGTITISTTSVGRSRNLVLYAMAGIMALAAIVARIGLKPGLQEQVEDAPANVS